MRKTIIFTDGTSEKFQIINSSFSVYIPIATTIEIYYSVDGTNYVKYPDPTTTSGADNITVVNAVPNMYFYITSSNEITS